MHIDKPRPDWYRRWLGEHRPRAAITCTVYDVDGKIPERQLWLVRCMDRFPAGAPDDGTAVPLTLYLAFGPAGEALPLNARIKTGPVLPGVTVQVQCTPDLFGVLRYDHAQAPNFTSN